MRELDYKTYNNYIKRSGLPPVYQKVTYINPYECDVETFTKIKDIMESALDGKTFDNGTAGNYLLYSSKCGNGKTTMACNIGLSFLEHATHCVYNNNTPLYFVNVADLLNTIKKSYSDSSISLSAIEKLIFETKVVIFDDLLTIGMSEYDIGKLYNYINYRTINNKVTIVTMNGDAEIKTADDLDSLNKYLYPRLTDRLKDFTLLTFEGSSARGKNFEKTYKTISIEDEVGHIIIPSLEQSEQLRKEFGEDVYN